MNICVLFIEKEMSCYSLCRPVMQWVSADRNARNGKSSQDTVLINIKTVAKIQLFSILLLNKVPDKAKTSLRFVKVPPLYCCNLVDHWLQLICSFAWGRSHTAKVWFCIFKCSARRGQYCLAHFHIALYLTRSFQGSYHLSSFPLQRQLTCPTQPTHLAVTCL